jgi:hypothetical protein
VRLRERLEIRDLADGVYHAHAGEQYELQALADAYGEDAVLDWLRAGVPTRQLDVPIMADLLGAGVTEPRFRWLLTAE